MGDRTSGGAAGAVLTMDERAAALGARLDGLLAAGRPDDACRVVADAFAARTDAGDLPELAALVSALPDRVIASCPQVLLELARACDASGRIRLRARLLDRAEGLSVPPTVRAPFALALAAERIVDLARDGRADDVEAAARDLSARSAEQDQDSVFVREARARASYALGRVLAWRGSPPAVAAAEDALSTAAGAARELGRHEWRSLALQTLGYSVHFYRGEEVRAASRLREAIALLPVGHVRRAGAATFLAEVYARTHQPDLARAILADVRDEAAHTGDQRGLGYVAWVAAVVAADEGAAAATLEFLAEAQRHPGDWFAHPAGTEFLADAALAAERVGETAAADHYLEQAVTRSAQEGNPDMAWLAAGIVHARRGDPERALDVLNRLLDEDWLPARNLWTIRLYLALARLRGGDTDGARTEAVRCFEAVTALVGPGRAVATDAGLPELLVRLEGDVARRIAQLAADAGSSLATQIRPPQPRVCLFGGLTLQLGTTTAPIRPGRPGLLLVLVALNERPLRIDAAIEELWPDVSPEVGRRRIRNVLARIKAAGGDLVRRQGELLTLAPGTVVDVDEFERAFEAVQRAPARDRPALARTALALGSAELLPEATHLARVNRRRAELELRTITLLTVVADAAERDGQTDEAVAALSRVADLDPFDPDIAQRCANLLLAAGRPREAATWFERAAAAEDD